MGAAEASVNGRRAGWNNMTVKIVPTGKPVFFTRGFSKIKFKDEHDGELVLGTGSIPIGKTHGAVKPDGSITMYREDAKALMLALKSVSPSIATVDFNIHVSWGPKDDEVSSVSEDRTQDAVLYNCSIKGRDFDASLSTKAQEVELPLLFTKLEVDGTVLYTE